MGHGASLHGKGTDKYGFKDKMDESSTRFLSRSVKIRAFPCVKSVSHLSQWFRKRTFHYSQARAFVRNAARFQRSATAPFLPLLEFPR